jgi:hypothetical protein
VQKVLFTLGKYAEQPIFGGLYNGKEIKVFTATGSLKNCQFSSFLARR